MHIQTLGYTNREGTFMQEGKTVVSLWIRIEDITFLRRAEQYSIPTVANSSAYNRKNSRYSHIQLNTGKRTHGWGGLMLATCSHSCHFFVAYSSLRISCSRTPLFLCKQHLNCCIFDGASFPVSGHSVSIVLNYHLTTHSSLYIHFLLWNTSKFLKNNCYSRDFLV
jgi:hypothetical protein